MSNMSNIEMFQVSLFMLKSYCLIFYLNHPYFHVPVQVYISNICFPATIGCSFKCFCFIQACFNPQGTRVLTGSSDKTARLWDPTTGECVQASILIFT